MGFASRVPIILLTRKRLIHRRRGAMPWQTDDPAREPTREEVDRMDGPVLLEFGATWCGLCRMLAPRLAVLLARYPDVRHIKIEDGPGQPLGRSFRVKLWPTLVFLRDGEVISQVARPHPDEVRQGLEAIAGAGALDSGERGG
jgi:thioredoxin 1